uniref:PRELI/MSF1 domain-containing protein n=1 Tax=Mastacembelus armatus TaxID=205130 RepID=A0A7N8Y877_9TELE
NASYYLGQQLYTHVLTKDVLYHDATPNNHLLSCRLTTKTNRLPRWVDCIFPSNVVCDTCVLEDSIVDVHSLLWPSAELWFIKHAEV